MTEGNFYGQNESFRNEMKILQRKVAKLNRSVSALQEEMLFSDGEHTVGLLEEKIKARGLRSDVTYYVEQGATGDGKSESPFGSIQEAIDALPKNLNGCAVNIVLKSAIYNESLIFDGFFGSWIVLSGESFTLNGTLTVSDARVRVGQNFNVVSSQTERAAVSIENGGALQVDSSLTVNANRSIDGISVGFFGQVYTGSSNNRLAVYNANNAIVSTGGYVYAASAVFSGNANDVYASAGAFVAAESGLTGITSTVLSGGTIAQ